MSYRGWRRNGTKYNATKCVVDGIQFDSRKEANYYCELKLLLRAGEISNLELQKKFELIPAQYEPDTTEITKTGKTRIVKGKCIERAVYYICDFAYTDNRTGKQVVADVKGFKPKEYLLKRKMFLYRYGFPITEV